MSLILSKQHLLRAVQAIFDEAGVEYWMDQGSLLGIVRAGDLIPGDHDIDLGVWRRDANRMRSVIVKGARQRGLRLKARSPHSMLFQCDRHDSCVQVSVAFYSPVLRDEAVKKVYHPPVNVGWLRMGAIKVFGFLVNLGDLPDSRLDPSVRTHRVIKKIRPWMPMILARSAAWVAGKGLYAARTSVSMRCGARHFRNLEEVMIGGFKIKLPSDAQTYLEYKYGPDWRTPRNDWVYWEEDGGVKESK